MLLVLLQFDTPAPPLIFLILDVSPFKQRGLLFILTLNP